MFVAQVVVGLCIYLAKDSFGWWNRSINFSTFGDHLQQARELRVVKGDKYDEESKND